jgi:hypothetical protein
MELKLELADAASGTFLDFNVGDCNCPVFQERGWYPHTLTLCQSNLNPYCMGRKAAFFQWAFKCT